MQTVTYANGKRHPSLRFVNMTLENGMKYEGHVTTKVGTRLDSLGDYGGEPKL